MKLKNASKPTKLATACAVAAATVLAPEAAMAFTAPTATDTGYQYYDLLVNKGAEGPIGMAGAGALLLWGGSELKNNIWKGAASAMGAATIVNLDGLLTSLGYVMPSGLF